MERLYDKLKAYSEKMKTEVESKAEDIRETRHFLELNSHTIWISRKSMVSMICITQMVF